jgi:hypothetical protein
VTDILVQKIVIQDQHLQPNTVKTMGQSTGEPKETRNNIDRLTYRFAVNLVTCCSRDSALSTEPSG